MARLRVSLERLGVRVSRSRLPLLSRRRESEGQFASGYESREVVTYASCVSWMIFLTLAGRTPSEPISTSSAASSAGA